MYDAIGVEIYLRDFEGLYAFPSSGGTVAPPPPDMRALYTALQGDQEAIDRFIGLITEATSPADFFAPEHMQRLLTRPTAQPH
jgi:hypothetical protein